MRCGDYLDQQIETVSVCIRRGFFDSLSTIGSRDAALGITEQLRFDQAIGERRAIDGDERAGPSAGGMGMAGEFFLAGTSLAADQDRHLACRSALNPSHNSRGRRVSGHELRGDCFRWRRTRSGNSLDHWELTRVLDCRDKLASDVVFKA